MIYQTQVPASINTMQYNTDPACMLPISLVTLTVRADMGSKRTPGRHFSMNSVSY